MSTLSIIFWLLVLLCCASGVCPLTCLHCTNAPKPRLCKTVTECDVGQVCTTEKTRNDFGEDVYNLGCSATSECSASGSGCVECCNSSLCNARGCGQDGYPLVHERICYNCPLYTNSNPCHAIDFCATGEVCMFESKTIFGDLVYSSRCAESNFCKQQLSGAVTIVGRELEPVDEMQLREIQSSAHCYGCCSEDLCNQQCDASHPVTTPAVSSCQSNPCINGQCVDMSGDFVCNCNTGYTGKTCNQALPTNYCLPSSCAHGTCYNISSGFICICDHGYEGTRCDISKYACDSNPCVHGTCIIESTGYSCVCEQWFEGKNCNIPISHCRSSPCQHGTCYDIENDFVCACEHRFEGKQCDVFSFPCESNPCVHGQCTNLRNGYSCQCDKGFIGKNCDNRPFDCYELLHKNLSSGSGVYSVRLWQSHRDIDVYCDMDTDGGGWTVFQSRCNGSVDFYRNFSEYEHGFGSLYGEFWLGLSYVQEMVAQNKTELRLDLTAANGSTAFEVFQNFRLGSPPDYTLNIDRGTGTVGDSDFTGLPFHNGRAFLTYDRPDPNGCAANYPGWWLANCLYVNLNGQYFTPGTDQGYKGIIYYQFEQLRVLKATQMKFRNVV